MSHRKCSTLTGKSRVLLKYHFDQFIFLLKKISVDALECYVCKNNCLTPRVDNCTEYLAEETLRWIRVHFENVVLDDKYDVYYCYSENITSSKSTFKLLSQGLLYFSPFVFFSFSHT